MQIRDRIKELRRVRAAELKPNPKNWRVHPEGQQNALRGVLAEVGYADALLARELADGTLELVNGHLRAETTPETEVPVLVIDVSQEEADLLLATLDPLAEMAEAEQARLQGLLGDVQTRSDALREALEGLAARHGAFEVAASELPALPDGDRRPIQQMTFSLTDDQAADVKRALAAAKEKGPFVQTGNPNSNANALARIVEAYLGQG